MIFDNEWMKVIIGENFCMEVNSPHLRKEQKIMFDIRWFIVNISLLYRITFCKLLCLCFIIHITGYNCFADITFDQREIGNFGYIVHKNSVIMNTYLIIILIFHRTKYQNNKKYITIKR